MKCCGLNYEIGEARLWLIKDDPMNQNRRNIRKVCEKIAESKTIAFPGENLEDKLAKRVNDLNLSEQKYIVVEFRKFA